MGGDDGRSPQSVAHAVYKPWLRDRCEPAGRFGLAIMSGFNAAAAANDAGGGRLNSGRATVPRAGIEFAAAATAFCAETPPLGA